MHIEKQFILALNIYLGRGTTLKTLPSCATDRNEKKTEFIYVNELDNRWTFTSCYI
jgi:hypothetical protein